MKWKVAVYTSLTPQEIHDIYHLRSEVFIVEQNCIYLDQDGKDLGAHHILGINDVGKIVAYARIMLPEPGSKCIHFGRVAVALDHRGAGLGRNLLLNILKYINACKLPKDAEVEISAQVYLTKFYESVGFRCVGSGYLEDGIPHIKMTVIAKAPSYPLRSLGRHAAMLYAAVTSPDSGYEAKPV